VQIRLVCNVLQFCREQQQFGQPVFICATCQPFFYVCLLRSSALKYIRWLSWQSIPDIDWSGACKTRTCRSLLEIDVQNAVTALPVYQALAWLKIQQQLERVVVQ